MIFRKISLSCYRKEAHGVAAVEFAMVVPFLVLVLLGILDFGSYINAKMRMENTSRAVAQYIVQGGDIESIETDIIASSNMSETERQSTQFSTEYACECRQGESTFCGDSCGQDDYLRVFVEVKMGMNYSPTLPWPGLPNNIRLTSAVRLQVQ